MQVSMETSNDARTSSCKKIICRSCIQAQCRACPSFGKGSEQVNQLAGILLGIPLFLKVGFIK